METEQAQNPPPASDPGPRPQDSTSLPSDGGPPPAPDAGGAPPKETVLDAITKGLKELREEARPAKRRPVEKPAEKPPEKVAEKPTEQPGEKPGEKPEEKAKSKEQDVTTPPEGLTARGQERWSKLTSLLKEKDALLEQRTQEAQRAQSEISTLRSLLQDARATPEDFGTALEYIKAVRTGDYETAQKMLIAQLRELQVAAGKTVDTGALDALADFKDLREAVQKFEITEDRALEIARARRMEEARRREAEESQRMLAANAAFVQERDAAVEAIRNMVKAWRESDLDFDVKEPRIADKIARLKAMPPRFWPFQVKQFYEDLNEAISLAGGLQKPANPPQGGASARPLSGSGGPAGTQRVPTTLLEAIRVGLGKQ